MRAIEKLNGSTAILRVIVWRNNTVIIDCQTINRDLQSCIKILRKWM